MITKFGVKNYKRFQDTSIVPFSDITILVGSNSSGKSSFIKALILFLDNIVNRGYSFFLDKERLFFDFHAVSCENINLGTFTRAINDKSKEDTIVLSAKFKEKECHRSIRFEIKRYDFDETLGYLSRVIIHEIIKDGETFYDFDINTRNVSISIPYKKIIESYASYGKLRRDKIAHGKAIWEDLAYDKLPSDIRHDAEQELAFLRNYEESINKKGIQPIVELDEHLNGSMIFEFPEVIFTIEKGYAKVTVPFTIPDRNDLITSLLAGILHARDDMNFTIRDIGNTQFVRTDIIESFLTNNTKELRSFNEKALPHIEYIYAHSISKKVFFSMDDRNDFIARTLHEAYQTRALRHNETQDFIRHWLMEFKIGDKIEISRIEGEGYSVKVIDKDGRFKNLADIGTGSAQIVLLLLKVAIILSTRQTEAVLLVIEEPEQNMHPNYQSLLADLFFAMQQKGIKLLVETHSEYLIRRSQVIVAKLCSEMHYTQEELDKKNPFRVIYFPESGQPYDMHYKVNGDFEHLFGEGFFDAAAKNRVELYKMQLEQNK